MPVGASVKSKGLGETEIPEVLKPLFNNLPEEEYKGIRDAVLNLWEEYGKNEDPNVFRWKVGLVLLRYVRDLELGSIDEREGLDLNRKFKQYYSEYQGDEKTLSKIYHLLYPQVTDPNRLVVRASTIIDAVDDLVPHPAGLLEMIPVKITAEKQSEASDSVKKKGLPTITTSWELYPSVDALFSSKTLSFKEKAQLFADGMWKSIYNEAEIAGWGILYSNKFADMGFSFSRGVNGNFTPGGEYENLNKRYEENKVDDVKLQTEEQTYQVEIETGLPKERSKKYDLVDYLKVYQYHVMFDFVRVYGEHTLDKDKQIFKFQPYIQKVDDHYEFGVEVNPDVDVLRDKFNDFFEDPRFRRYIFGISMLGGAYQEALSYKSQKEQGDPLYWTDLAVESSLNGKTEEFIKYMKDAKKYLPIVFLDDQLRYLDTKSGGKVDKSKARLNEIQTTVIPVYENYLEGTATKDDVLDAIMNLSFVKNDKYLKQAIRKNSGDLSKLLLGLIEGVLPDKGPSITGKELNHILDPKNKNSYVYRLYTSYNVRIHASSYLNGLRVLAKLEDYLNEKNWSFSQLAYHVATAKSPDDEVIKDLANILKGFVNKNSQIKKTSEEEIRQAIYDLRAQPMFALMLIGVGGHLGLDYSKIARFDQDWSQFWKEEDIEVRDENGKPVLDENGNPVKIPMKDFISTLKQLKIEGFYVPEFEFNEQAVSAIDFKFTPKPKFERFEYNKMEFVHVAEVGNVLNINFDKHPETDERLVKQYPVVFDVSVNYSGDLTTVTPDGKQQSSNVRGDASYAFVLVRLVDMNGNPVENVVPQLIQADEHGKIRVRLNPADIPDGEYVIKGLVVGHPTIPKANLNLSVENEVDLCKIIIGGRPASAEVIKPPEPGESYVSAVRSVQPKTTFSDDIRGLIGSILSDEGIEVTNENINRYSSTFSDQLDLLLVYSVIGAIDKVKNFNFDHIEEILDKRGLLDDFQDVMNNANSPKDLIEGLFGISYEDLLNGDVVPLEDQNELQNFMYNLISGTVELLPVSVEESYSIDFVFTKRALDALLSNDLVSLYEYEIRVGNKHYVVYAHLNEVKEALAEMDAKSVEVSATFRPKYLGVLLGFSAMIKQVPYDISKIFEDPEKMIEFNKPVSEGGLGGWSNFANLSGTRAGVYLTVRPIYRDLFKFDIRVTHMRVGVEGELSPGGGEPIHRGVFTDTAKLIGDMGVQFTWNFQNVNTHLDLLGGVKGVGLKAIRTPEERRKLKGADYLYGGMYAGIDVPLSRRVLMSVSSGGTYYSQGIIAQFETGLKYKPPGSSTSYSLKLQIYKSYPKSLTLTLPNEEVTIKPKGSFGIKFNFILEPSW